MVSAWWLVCAKRQIDATRKDEKTWRLFAAKRRNGTNQLIYISPILRIGDQVPTFDVFWPKHVQEVRLTVNIHVQSI